MVGMFVRTARYPYLAPRCGILSVELNRFAVDLS
jgi:hypothetical protein